MARTAKPDVRIVADVHEVKSGVPALLEELGAKVELAPLPAGDYALGADTLVERKRVADLHSSVPKGHLWPQLARLRAACAFPYLLVEGTHLDRGGLSANAIRGVCLAAIDQGIALLRSDTQRDSALWLHRLAVRCQREELPPERPAPLKRPRPAGEDAAEALLATVPGISTVGARALLARFGTIAGVLDAGPDAWRDVPGIGTERARTLAAALGVLPAQATSSSTDR
jgi:DNA excision repair protein ERCC-4